MKRLLLNSYAVAVLATSTLLIVLEFLQPVFRGTSPVLLFLVGVMLATWRGGFRAGLLATLLSASASAYFLAEPYQSWQVIQGSEQVRIVLFACVGSVLSLMVAYLRQAEGQALREVLRQKEHLEHEMATRKQAEEALKGAYDELERRVEERTAQLSQTTELTKAERQRFYDVLETLPVYVCLLTPDYRMPFANRMFREWFGYQPRKKCHELLFNRSQPCEYCETYRVLQSNTPRRWEWTGPNGCVYDIFDFPFIDTDGSPLILEMGIDITHRKQAEQEIKELNETLEQRIAQRTMELQQSREDLHRAQSVGQIGWWRLDTRTNVLKWSAENHRIFGVPESTPLSYEDFLSIVHPDDRKYVDTQWQAGLRGEPYDIEHRILVDGKVKWVREKGDLEFGDDGELLGGFGITQDITPRKEAEEALRRSEARWNAAIESFAEGAIIATENEQVIYWNPAAREMHGFTRPEEGIEPLEETRAMFQLWTPDGSHLLKLDEWPMRRIKRGETVRNLELRIRRPDQGWEKVFSYSGTMVDTSGGERLIFLTCQDLTELRRAEQALQEADRRKSEFLAILAHELRNPLAPIRNALHILKRKGPPDPVLHTAQDIIDRQLTNMVRLIDDLLDVSRITRGRLQLRKERVELAVVLDNAIESTRPHLDQAAHALIVSLPPQPVYLDADPMRLMQVFLNLLHNACKYTERGGRIGVAAELDGTDVVATISDNGIGIAPEHLAGIFEMFSQVGGGAERSQGGLGIGLALTRGLVQMHGGTIEGRSAGAGQGSEFIVRLSVLNEPTASAAPGDAQHDGSRQARPLCILVVDDNCDNAESLAVMLATHDYEVKTAHDGLEAVEAAARFHPDVILLDIGMPRLDGYGACRRIREQPREKEPQIFAITGWGQEEDRRKSQDAGFDGHLVKPVDPSALMQLLEGSQASVP